MPEMKDRQIGVAAPPRAELGGEEGLVLAGRKADGALVRRDFVDRRPVGAREDGAKRSRAPVDADEGRRAHEVAALKIVRRSAA